MVSLRSRFLMIVAFAAVVYGLPAPAQAQEGRLSGVVGSFSVSLAPAT